MRERGNPIIRALVLLDEIEESNPRIICLAKAVKYDGSLEGWKGF